jgi:hypothetical protein
VEEKRGGVDLQYTPPRGLLFPATCPARPPRAPPLSSSHGCYAGGMAFQPNLCWKLMGKARKLACGSGALHVRLLAPPPPARRQRRQRPGRNRQRRKREVEGQKTAPASASVETAVVAATASKIAASPPSGSPPAKRPRTRAVTREGGRQDLPTPEISRASGEATPCVLDISYGEEFYARRDSSPPPSTPATPAPPLPPTTPSTPTPTSFAAEVRDYLCAWATRG